MIFSTQRRRDAHAQRKTRGFLSFFSATLYLLVTGLKKSKILILLSSLLWFLSANTKKIFLFPSASLRICVSLLKKSQTVTLILFSGNFVGMTFANTKKIFLLLSAPLRLCASLLKKSQAPPLVLSCILNLLLAMPVLPLQGELPVEVSFFDLPKLEQQHEKEIRIRGFLYETKNKEFILASSPNIKNCCVDKASTNKIYVYGLQKGNELQKALTIEGRLYVSRVYSGVKYELQNARIAVENKSQTFNLALIILGCAIALIFYIFNRSTKECTAKA